MNSTISCHPVQLGHDISYTGHPVRSIAHDTSGQHQSLAHDSLINGQLL